MTITTTMRKARRRMKAMTKAIMRVRTVTMMARKWSRAHRRPRVAPRMQRDPQAHQVPQDLQVHHKKLVHQDLRDHLGSLVMQEHRANQEQQESQEHQANQEHQGKQE